MEIKQFIADNAGVFAICARHAAYGADADARTGGGAVVGLRVTWVGRIDTLFA